MQNASNGKFAEAEEVRQWQEKPHHNAENVTDCWSEEHGMGFSVTAILKSKWSALELMHGVKPTGEWPSCGLFALETQLRVWSSDTVWMDLRLLLLELCCSSPGAFGAVMDSVGWEGTQCCTAGLSRAFLPDALHCDTSTTLLLLMPGIDSHYCQRCKGNLKKNKTTSSMLGCFSLERLLCEQQEKGEWRQIVHSLSISELGGSKRN